MKSLAFQSPSKELLLRLNHEKASDDAAQGI